MNHNEQLVPHGVHFGIGNMTRYDNMFGASKKETVSWAKNLKLDNSGSRIFYASCMCSLMWQAEVFLKATRQVERIGLSYESALSAVRSLQDLKLIPLTKSLLAKQNNAKPYYDSLIDAIRVMDYLGVQCAYLYENEPCCGSIYHTYGDPARFIEHANHVYDFLRRKGVKEIITSNPICASILKNFYPQHVSGFDICIRTFVEVVCEELQQRDLKFELEKPITVTFHDPCYQVRYLKQIDEPRIIMEKIKGLKIVEPENSKSLVRCCGAGGVETVYPDIGLEMAKNRVQELIETNADKIVTSCPACMLMLRLGLHELGVKKEVLDISTIISRALVTNRVKASNGR